MKKESKTRCYPSFSDEDFDLKSFKWRLNKGGYAVRTTNVNGRPIVTTAHQEVCIKHFGKKPSGELVCDHINRNKLDNRRENLRIVSVTESNRNRSVVEHAKLVTLHKCGRFQVAFRNKYVGLFKTKIEAEAKALELKGRAQP